MRIRPLMVIVSGRFGERELHFPRSSSVRGADSATAPRDAIALSVAVGAAETRHHALDAPIARGRVLETALLVSLATMSAMPGTDRVKPASPGVKLTYDDFVLFPDDGKRHELIDGEHYVTPSPNIRHQRLSGRLHLAVGNWLEAHPVGQIFYAPLDVVMSMFDVVEPDLLYLSNERAAEVVVPLHVRGTPELVIEIASAWNAQA